MATGNRSATHIQIGSGLVVGGDRTPLFVVHDNALLASTKPSNPGAVYGSTAAADLNSRRIPFGGHAWLDLFLLFTGTAPTTPLKVKGWGFKDYPPIGDQSRFAPSDLSTPFPGTGDLFKRHPIPLDNPASGATELTFPTTAYLSQDLTALSSTYAELLGLPLSANPTLVAYGMTTRMSYHIAGFDEGFLTISQACDVSTRAIIVGQLTS